MNGENVSIITIPKGDIPEELLPKVAEFMAYSKLEPGLSAEYFLDSLRRPITPEWNEKYGVYFSLAVKGDEVVGWGHFSFSKLDQFIPELYVKVHHRERRNGIGSQIIRELLERIPHQIQEITIPAMKEEFGSKFVQLKLGGQVIEEDMRGLLKLYDLDYETFSQELKQHDMSLERDGIKLEILGSKEIIEKNLIHDIVKLQEIAKLDGKPINWTFEKEKEKINEYLRMLDNSKRTEQIHDYILASFIETGEIVGMTHTARNFERNKLIAWHECTIVNPEFKHTSIQYSLIGYMLEYLRKNTEVTHWIVQNYYEDKLLQKTMENLGFDYFVTNLIHKVSRADWEIFLN